MVYICTYLGLGIDVDPVCLSLAVLWGIGPAPAFRPVTGIRIVRNLCLLAHHAWELGPRSAGVWAQGHPGPGLVPCMDKDTTPTLSPAPECWPSWQGDTTLDLPLTWGRLCALSPPAAPSPSGLVPRKEALQLPHLSTLSVAYGSSA